MIGVASTVQNRPSNPDGAYLPPMNFRCLDLILEAGRHKIGIPYLPDRSRNSRAACRPSCLPLLRNCTTGCDVGAFFSTPWIFLPPPKAEATNLDLRTNALSKNVLVDENGRAKGVAYIDRHDEARSRGVRAVVVVAASCVESARIVLNSKSRHWPKESRIPADRRAAISAIICTALGSRLLCRNCSDSRVSRITWPPVRWPGCRAGRTWITRARRSSFAVTPFTLTAAARSSRGLRRDRRFRS